MHAPDGDEAARKKGHRQQQQRNGADDSARGDAPVQQDPDREVVQAGADLAAADEQPEGVAEAQLLWRSLAADVLLIPLRDGRRVPERVGARERRRQVVAVDEEPGSAEGTARAASESQGREQRALSRGWNERAPEQGRVGSIGEEDEPREARALLGDGPRAPAVARALVRLGRLFGDEDAAETWCEGGGSAGQLRGSLRAQDFETGQPHLPA